MAIDPSSSAALVPILYQDQTCICFNKPPGLLIIPTQKGDEYTLTRMVNDQYPQYGELLPAHRLDRDTSGVILYAKGKQYQEQLMQLFKEKKMGKTYIAFVHGKLDKPKGRIRIPIKDWHQRQFAKHLPAQSALTEYALIEQRRDYAVVEVRPITGRTNQIRIHFTKIGNPLVGEDKYVFRRDYNLRFRRCALHAKRLVFKRLQDQKEVVVEVDLPDDMQEFLKKHPK